MEWVPIFNFLAGFLFLMRSRLSSSSLRKAAIAVSVALALHLCIQESCAGFPQRGGGELGTLVPDMCVVGGKKLLVFVQLIS